MSDKTCGVFILDADDQLLICHATNFKYGANCWSIPKGWPDENEDYRSAAIRELMEETGLEIDPASILELPPVLYKTGKKTLYPFVGKLVKKGSELSLICTSYVEKPDCTFPEIDRFEWVSLDIAGLALHESQGRCIELVESIINRK